jgi:penicillin-binding protein 2
MFVRRLLILFVLLGLGAAALCLRLVQLQIVQAATYRAQAQAMVNRHYIIETSRGTIRDRYGRALAQDVPCYDLAIDYRAMNLDDQWITREAVRRLNAAGVRDRRDRLTQLPGLKAQIAAQIDAIPNVLALICPIPGEPSGDPKTVLDARLEMIRERYELIRARMDALRQTHWTFGRYDRLADARNIADGLVDPDLTVDLKEEAVAHTIIPAVPDPIVFQLDKELDNYPGLRRVDAKRRVYPYGPIAAHLIGVMRPITDTEYAGKLPRFDRPDLSTDEPGDLKGYLQGDETGAFGAEALAETALRGTRGVRLVEVGGDEQTEKRRNPVAGQDVRLTIDIELQRQLTEAILDPRRDLLKGQDGQNHQVALVVLSLDGQILAMVTTPTFDLNNYRQNLRAMRDDETNLPLLNRAVASVYPPGSTIKPLIAAAALMEGVTTPQETIVCNGYLYPRQPNILRCSIYTDFHSTHGPVQLDTALEQSCNIYFYTMGGRLGLERLSRWFGAFGLGTATGTGLIEETHGSVPGATSVSDPDTAQRESILLGIGQGPLAVTPLQMANAYATLLRGGVLVPPRLLLEAPLQQSRAVTISPEALAAIRRGLELVVSGDHGTAHRILHLKLPVAGKTGSATAARRVIGPDGKPTIVRDSDAWFIGYAPADHPRFVVAALKEFGGHGGTTATPLAKEAFLALEKLGYLPKED